MENTVLEDGHIKPLTKRVRDAFIMSSGGAREIDLAQYDGFIACSMGLGIQRLLLQPNTHLPLEFMPDNSPYTVLSDDGWNISAREAIYSSTAFKFIRYFRTFSGKPIALLPEPAPMEHFGQVARAQRQFRWLSEPFAPALYARMLVIHVTALKEIAAEFDLHLIPQVKSTMTSTGLTKASFHNSDLENDFGHMNTSYGETMIKSRALKAFLATI